MNRRRMTILVAATVGGLLLCCTLACVVGVLTGVIRPYGNTDIARGYAPATPAVASAATPRRPVPTVAEATPQLAAGAPASPTATPAYPTAQQGEIVLTVRNLSPRVICEVVVSPTESGTWGERNLLLAPLAAADSITVRFAATELYDVLLVGCDETPMGSFAELATGQSYTLNVGEVGDEAQIRLVNQGPVDVCVVIIVPAGMDITNAHTADLLGRSEVVAAGDARWLFVPPGTKDMLALDCDGNTLSQRQGRELAAQGYTWYVPDADSHTPAATTRPAVGDSQRRGPGHPAPLPQKETPPPTPVKPTPPPTPGLPEPTAPSTAVPATTAPHPAAPTSNEPPPTPTTPVVILLPETGYGTTGGDIRDPWLLLAPIGLLGLGLVLSGLGGILRLHPYCWLGFHEWVAQPDGRRREGQYVDVPHTCLACGRHRTFRLRAPADSQEGSEDE